MAEKLYREAIQEALREEMLRDENLLLIGEDIGLYGGAYGATKGLFDEFGEDRVRDTPISEMVIAGAAVGASMCGCRVVAEIMYEDFLTLSMDQLCNQGAKNRYMFGGHTTVPMVLRTEGGAGRCIAAQHSQSIESLFMHIPGLLMVAPSTPYDVKGLLKTAIREDDPILFIEHKMLYGNKGEVPDDEELLIPLGKAAVRRQGNDVTMVSYSRMALRAQEAAEELAGKGIEADVIDLRSLKPLDIETVLASVAKTGRLVLLSEGCKNNNLVCEIAMRVNEFGFDYLDAPMLRICAANTPVPMSPTLEDAMIPNVDRIVAEVTEYLGA
ncbi:MAG: alpha-ketoacid dehydrogenase subunit beta [Planctomycetota bacterium]